MRYTAAAFGAQAALLCGTTWLTGTVGLAGQAGSFVPALPAECPADHHVECSSSVRQRIYRDSLGARYLGTGPWGLWRWLGWRCECPWSPPRSNACLDARDPPFSFHNSAFRLFLFYSLLACRSANHKLHRNWGVYLLFRQEATRKAGSCRAWHQQPRNDRLSLGDGAGTTFPKCRCVRHLCTRWPAWLAASAAISGP